ncbi:threonine/serine exporter family protein [Clostridium omnivorum]|uniref:Membrane protein n=1 Tax=Clostridium omnivorum TaxID=1604902 RepID=A0ABQ5N078_9CLOT|nr:threonine/serine exporter family protein [Clostridium sp. E14]GLC28619.1 membrane protein [Clostridium sp. E14]
MSANRIIHIAADAGKIILENGGETYRVEETMSRICNAFGISLAESFVTPTGIMISVTTDCDQTITIVKRIKSRTVDLEKIAKVNDLSRNIKSQGLTLDQVKVELNTINTTKRYSDKTLILFSCITVSFFTLMFGGDFHDFCVSFIIGGLIKILTLALSKVNLNDFFINVLGGALAALLALLSVNFNLATHVDKITIGSIMLLVPGLSITNAIRDTIAGDLLAGISRALEAFLIAVAIAAGSGTIITLWVIYFGGSLI